MDVNMEQSLFLAKHCRNLCKWQKKQFKHLQSSESLSEVEAAIALFNKVQSLQRRDGHPPNSNDFDANVLIACQAELVKRAHKLCSFYLSNIVGYW